MKGKRVWVAGHKGMVGSAIVRRLEREDCEVIVSERTQVDLRRQEQVERFVKERRPHLIFLAAAKVGGILANASYPADFLFDNLAIQNNVIDAAYRNETEKLVFLGSSCIYPKLAPQPIKEDALLTGPLEPTNEWYAIAKIAGIKLCQAYRRQYGCDFVSAMPTNLYGPGDNFNLETSHVAAALMVKAVRAKEAGTQTLEVWGSGKPLREFLHVDDCADALVFIAQHYSADEHINVGFGRDLSIAELAQIILDAVGTKASLAFDPSKPDGTPRKLMDSSRLAALGWKPKIGLREGMQQTLAWYLANAAKARA
ncbi:MAG: GDP-L-fucose synthase [Xanthobacteraceae bacterium]|nr:GDP-L-fucose synthase [Xanthobacteraceae bacterium]QYK46624.1 MAG: GDP-L-fucose synthase [Xanthobacteraceae bacterium]